MPAAAKASRDFAHVRVGLAAKAHANEPVVALAQQRGDLYRVDVANRVDNPFRILAARAAGAYFLLRNERNADTPVLEELRLADREGVQLKLMERLRAE
ncbi:hypothetical protein SDC9_206570 [bioreactor metagenome]|uniref:Uncharacterized protein n=1 Tax=bioreactor metagenome TaxID=1076179 RepID=A0A645JEM8_9ZZZZ